VLAQARMPDFDSVFIDDDTISKRAMATRAGIA
jgi:hypothetical protein